MVLVPIRALLTLKTMPRPLWYMHSVLLASQWDLMFVMGRVQDNSEQIALLRGGKAELSRFSSVLKILLRNNLAITFWSTVHTVLIMLMSTAFMLPILVKLMYQVCDQGLPVSAAMTISSQVFAVGAHLDTLASGSQLLMRFQQTVANMTEMLRAGKRVREGVARRGELGRRPGHVEPHTILVQQRDPLDLEGPVVEMKDVTVWAPKAIFGHGVFSGFSMRLMPGDSMLIVGDTGVGKSALLRAVHGLWWCGSGRVERCRNSQLSCMPERPFTYLGTLRQNLLYPEVEDAEGITDDLIMETLKALNLDHLANAASLDSEVPWHSILSLGQQQRLGFARILLRPHIRLVLLDEATSALDMKNERRIYALLRERFPCHVSVGHRPSVREYHTHVAVLRFQADRSRFSSEVQYMPIGDFDFGTLTDATQAKLRGNDEERLWTQHAMKQAEVALKARGEERGQEQVGAGTADKTSPDSDEKEDEDSGEALAKQVKLISLKRRWGGFSLLVRACRDIIGPMLTQREVCLPIFGIFGIAYVFSYMSLAMEMWFGYPYSQIISIVQARNTALCWSFFFRTLCLYYPFQLFFTTMARVFLSLQGVICRVTIKWYLAKCYLDTKTDAYYHMSVARIVDGNPGTRISAWDADAANTYITTLVSTLSSASFGVMISCRSLYAMDRMAFVYFVVYIVGGAIFYMITGYQVFVRYITWLDLTMKLHHKVLHVREHSESIALLQGSDIERRMAFEMMDRAITPGSRYLWLKDASAFMGNAYFSNLSDSVITLMTGPMVLNGTTTFSGQTQMKGVFGAGSGGVQSMMMEMLFNVEGQAAMERVWELLAAILHIQGAQRGKGRFGGDLEMQQDPDMDLALELKDVSLRTPVSSGGSAGCALLVKDVTLQVPFGDSLLIAGESGIGKSSMLRAVAGLWRHGQGVIRVPDDRRSFFVPQRPYVFIGNLRENLLYPDTERTDIDDNTLRYITETVGLQHLLDAPGLGENRRHIEERADVNSEHDKGWFWRLSLGELQRLNFGRLLLKGDFRLVFLDEATSALSVESEEEMYTLVKKHASSYISVAHRPQLRRFHQRAFVMLTDHTKPADAGCKTKCLLMTMDQYEKELEVLSQETPGR